MVRSAEPPVTAMGNVVNLGRARKRKQRADEQRRADENAIRHGRTKAEKAREHMEQARLRATVDGARRDPGVATGEPTDGPTEEPTVDPTEHDPTQDGPTQDDSDT
jgi:hypothetical protein